MLSTDFIFRQQENLIEPEMSGWIQSYGDYETKKVFEASNPVEFKNSK